MQKKLAFLLLAAGMLLAVGCGGKGGNAGYNPDADADAQLDSALSVAQREGKNVMVQVGGSWCPWCVRLHELLTNDEGLHTQLSGEYVWVQIYYGRDKANASALSRLGENVKGYGFPVLVVLAPSGKVLHTQCTGDLEEGNGYSKAKVQAFLEQYKDVPIENAVAAEEVEVAE